MGEFTDRIAADFADKLSRFVTHGGKHGVRLQGVEVLG